MRPVHFAAARRTPIGKLRGSLSSVRPDDLAATVVRASSRLSHAMIRAPLAASASTVARPDRARPRTA